MLWVVREDVSQESVQELPLGVGEFEEAACARVRMEES